MQKKNMNSGINAERNRIVWDQLMRSGALVQGEAGLAVGPPCNGGLSEVNAYL